MPVSGDRERVHLRTVGVQQVEALPEWPGDGAAWGKRPDAISKPGLSCLWAFPELVNGWQGRLNLDTDVRCDGRATVADHQIQQCACHVVGTHIYPDVGLGSINS
jgi:hypothetical protein